MPSGQLSNSIILHDLDVHLGHLTLNQRKDIVALIEGSLFCDIPSQTTGLQHDIDVGDARHPYRLNPKKHELRKAEAEYLCQKNFASQRAWCSPCLLVPKSDSSVCLHRRS